MPLAALRGYISISIIDLYYSVTCVAASFVQHAAPSSKPPRIDCFLTMQVCVPLFSSGGAGLIEPPVHSGLFLGQAGHTYSTAQEVISERTERSQMVRFLVMESPHQGSSPRVGTSVRIFLDGTIFSVVSVVGDVPLGISDDFVNLEDLPAQSL